jgi:hypothetical protein
MYRVLNFLSDRFFKKIGLSVSTEHIVCITYFAAYKKAIS